MRAIRLLSVIVTMIAAGVSLAQAQSDYPNKPVHLVVGFIPGS